VTGSGAGVGACGGGAAHWPAGYRDTTVRFCATDDPVTPTQLANADAGNYTGSNGHPGYPAPEPGVLHQLPWAGGAIGVIVHVPEGCVLPAPTNASGPSTGYSGDPSGDSTTDHTTRPLIPDLTLEKAFAGDPSVSTWGQLVPGITGTVATAASTDAQGNGMNCTDFPVVRIVRQDNSGSTFNFKSYLSLVNGGIGADPTNGWLGSVSLSGNGGANTVWPTGGSFSSTFDANLASGSGGNPAASNGICDHTTAGHPNICGGNSSGAGNVAKAVLATNGSIGYADIATDRNTTLAGVPAVQATFEDVKTSSGTRDYTFWLPLQNNPDQAAGKTFVEATHDATDHLNDPGNGGTVGTRGANCVNLPALRGVPTTPSDPTLGDWSHAIATGGSGYPICVLTYGLFWDDNSKVYGNTPAEEAKARTALDYVKFIASPFGQTFSGTDFSTIPNSAPFNLLQILQNGVNAIDWNKTQCTSNCTTSTQTTTPSTTTTTTTTATKPPPNNRFTVSGAHAKGKKLTLTLKLPGGGRIKIVATFRFKGKTVTFASLSSSVHGGNGTVTLNPTSKAVSDLGKTSTSSSIKVTIAITFTPTGGRSNTTFASIKVKGLKKPTRRH
jgi:ABC-type phosphate transport system substrate-binding protein